MSEVSDNTGSTVEVGLTRHGHRQPHVAIDALTEHYAGAVFPVD
jgi:hypothetical protein